MQIIQKYIAFEYTKYFLTCLLSLLSVAVVFAMIPELKNLEKENGWKIFVDEILSGVPLLIEIITPISVLLATILTFIALKKSSETVAMEAAGVSYFYMIFPILVIGLLIGFFSYFNQSYLAPWWGADKRTGVMRLTSDRNIWRFYKGRLFYFAGLSPRTNEIEQGKIFRFDRVHRIQQIDTLKGFKLDKGQWHTKIRTKTVFSPATVIQSQGNVFNVKEDQFPVIFKKELYYPKYSSFSDIFTEIRIKNQGGVNFIEELFALYQKISSFAGIFVMILLALPFSLLSTRESNMRKGIVTAVILGFVYWLIDQIFVSFSGTGLLLIEISAFGANILFSTLIFLLIYFRRA